MKNQYSENFEKLYSFLNYVYNNLKQKFEEFEQYQCDCKLELELNISKNEDETIQCEYKVNYPFKKTYKDSDILSENEKTGLLFMFEDIDIEIENLLEEKEESEKNIANENIIKNDSKEDNYFENINKENQKNKEKFSTYSEESLNDKFDKNNIDVSGTKIDIKDLSENNHVKYSLNRIIPFVNIKYLKVINNIWFLILYDENNNKYISFFDSNFNELQKYNINNEINENSIINVFKIDISEKDAIKLIIVCYNNLYLFSANLSCEKPLIKTIKSDRFYINYIHINHNFLMFGPHGAIVLNKNILHNNFWLANNLITRINGVFDGGIILNKNIFILASSRRILLGEDKLIFFKSNNLKILREIKNKNFSFSLLSEGILIFPIQERIEKYILVCTCETGIFLTILLENLENGNEISKPIKNFKPEILRKIKYKEFLFNLLVGGFHNEEKEMRVKIFMIEFNNNNRNIEIHQTQEIMFIQFNNSIRINYINHSKMEEELFVYCNNGRIYSFLPSI